MPTNHSLTIKNGTPRMCAYSECTVTVKGKGGRLLLRNKISVLAYHSKMVINKLRFFPGVQYTIPCNLHCNEIGVLLLMLVRIETSVQRHTTIVTHAFSDESETGSNGDWSGLCVYTIYNN